MSDDNDGFISKFSGEGQLLFSSYLGGNNQERIFDLSVFNDRILITLTTSSNDFPHEVPEGFSEFQREDAINHLVNIDSEMCEIVWSIQYGGYYARFL